MKINKGFTKIYDGIINKYGDVIQAYNKDVDGYEIFLKEGYYWELMGEGVRTLLEYTLNDLSESVNKGIKKEKEFKK